MTYEWVRNPALERAFKRDHAELRAKMATGWRKARKANPAIARLLWRRMRKAEKEFAETWWSKP